MLGWLTRCLPGFSILALVFLLICAFSNLMSSHVWRDIFPPWVSQPLHGGYWIGLNLAQVIFVIYAMLIHFQMFAFTIRLAWSIFRVTAKTREALGRRLPQRSVSVSSASSSSASSSSPSTIFDEGYESRSLSPVSLPSPNPFNEKLYSINAAKVEEELVHAIILPNYSEDLHTLETTLNVLASHPRARSQYEIYLAMEQKEVTALDKAAHLVSKFERSFLHIRPTFHPAGIQGEIAGKSSNVAFAANRIVEIHHADLNAESCNIVVTVMDADTHLSRDYFTEIRRLHYAHIDEADRALYCCPIIFDRNSHETPLLVRCADLLWGFAGISTMYPGTMISIPTSVYSLPLSLAEKVGGWDSDPTAIGEDMHMLLKCYFETAGNVISRVVYIPASQCNVSSDRERGWRRVLGTCVARYRQALRHMWGALDSGFAARRTLGYLRFHKRCSFLSPRHFALMHLLWEAHFLPCHMVIIMVFSVLYTILHPAFELHPILAKAFFWSDVLRTSSFIGMNICLSLYERWHSICVNSRMQDMHEANLLDTGFSPRVWYRLQHLAERICFPIAGTLYGAIPALHAVFLHFWTDRLVYRVSKKPTFNLEAVSLA